MPHPPNMESTSTSGSVDTADRRETHVDGRQPSSATAELASPQPQHAAAPPAPGHTKTVPQHPARKSAKCRFFTSQKGCRAGDACRYLHVASEPEGNGASSAKASATGMQQASSQDGPGNAAQDVTTRIENLAVNDGRSQIGMNRAQNSASRRPVSTAEAQNPREFQLSQLRRRFRPAESHDETGTTLTFGLHPSDPDFPFELEKLQCVLHIPLTYPSKGRPALQITNPEMERDFQANVERGFDDIVDSSIRTHGRGTLLAWMNSLDRRLERLLTSTERGPTLKFIANVGDKHAMEDRTPVTNVTTLSTPRISQPETRVTSHCPLQPAVKPQNYTAQEKAEAEVRRKNETRQLEARMGRLPLFRKFPDGRSFIVPVQVGKPDRLPLPLRSIKTVKLVVPMLYPLEKCQVELQGVERDSARAVEAAFEEWVGENPKLNLVSQVNFLASNLHNFANRPLEKTPDAPPVVTELQQSEARDLPVVAFMQPGPTDEPADDRPHLHIIPRPPEWAAPYTGSESDLTEESASDSESTDDEEVDGGAPVPERPGMAGRGVALSFPFLELYGIELLELVNLYVTLKCDRCKESMDVKNIRSANTEGDGKPLAPRQETCKKCANSMSIGFRRQLIHINSNRAGYLDLDGCTVVDLLPSNFIPTCAECSTPFPAPGVTAVRGESAMANCRECHRKMVLKIPEVKFLIVGAAAATSRSALPRRKKRDVLGIVAGQELPRRGRCPHYGKSYRWFRFSCCSKVFPCDKCHDAATGHPNEHANRMICGFCSREQTYRPEDCGICRAILVGKAGSGFWEGGKGTRNKVLMSRKDPRKYKRRGGTAPGGASSSKKK